MRRYDDMLDLSPPVSRRHPPMSRHDRAAQFAAFAALTGFDAILAESGRETQERLIRRADGVLIPVEEEWKL